MRAEILVFELDAQRYAIPLDQLVEVVRAVAIARLPAAPQIVEGVINVRGRITPVLDLRSRFGHPPRELEPSQHFIIARAGDRIVALRADRAVGLARVAPSDLVPLESTVPRARYITSVAKTPDGVVLIHNVAEFLSESESESLDEALHESGGAPR